MNLKQGIKLTAILGQLDLKITDPKAEQEEVGADLIMQILTKAHRAEAEIYEFVAEIKGITPQEAEKISLIEFINEITSNKAAMDFFKRAVK